MYWAGLTSSHRFGAGSSEEEQGRKNNNQHRQREERVFIEDWQDIVYIMASQLLPLGEFERVEVGGNLGAFYWKKPELTCLMQNSSTSVLAQRYGWL